MEVDCPQRPAGAGPRPERAPGVVPAPHLELPPRRQPPRAEATAPGRLRRSIGAAVARLGRAVYAERRWVLCIALLAVLWATEVFVVQCVTVVPSRPPSSYLLKLLVRFTLDLSLIAAVVVCLPRVAVAAVAAAAAAGNLGLITYWGYFGESLTATVALSSVGEACQVAADVVGVVPWPAAAALGAVLLVKLVVLHLAGRPGLAWRVRAGVSLAGMAVYAGVFLTVVGTTGSGCLSRIRTRFTSPDMMVTHGYLPAWLAEMTYLNDDAVLRRALARREQVTDRLTPLEAHLGLPDRVAVVQVETLDFAVLDHEVGGQPVTPFLNRLRRRSMFYRIEAMHRIGSCDADFTLLNGVEPSGDLVTYKIEGYPYGDALPHLLQAAGYCTVCMHGAAGNFYARREAFEKMGFARLLFEEEFNRELGVASGSWGIYDTGLLAHSARRMQRAPGKQFHFLITLTSHGPFRQLKPQDREIYPAPTRRLENYLNCMRFVDDALREYVSALPPGTLVVVYGDHASSIFTADFTSDRSAAGEFVPCMIHLVGGNLAERQQTRGRPIAQNGKLTLLDVARYLRHLVKQALPAGRDSKAPEARVLQAARSRPAAR